MRAPRWLIPLLALLCSGCGIFTDYVRSVGFRHEEPVAAPGGRGAVETAWTDEARSRLCVRFRTKSARGRHTRYLNLTSREVWNARWASPENTSWWGGKPVDAFAMAKTGEKLPLRTLSAHYFLERRVDRRPKWKTRTMTRLSLRPVGPDPHALEDGPVLWVRVLEGSRTRVYFPMRAPEGEARRMVVFNVPRRPYRTAGGKIAQVFLPAAVALDIVTSPIQYGVGFYCWTHGIGL